jgi:hypothetical protein
MGRSLALVVVLGVSVSAQAEVDVLLHRLTQWLVVYEPALSALVADEKLEQQFRPTNRSMTAYTRRLVSTYSFIRLPGDNAWLGLREVERLNRERIKPGGPALKDILAKPGGDLYPLARDLAWRNAQHNLGSPRTTNVPTLPLELMAARHRHRFTFAIAGADRLRGAPVTRVTFNEEERPSLVRSPDGKENLPTRGVLWIAPATGALLRGEVEAYQERINAREWKLTVDFAMHRELNIPVPVEAREEFYMANGKGTARARYDNFRQFTTTARILQ